MREVIKYLLKAGNDIRPKGSRCPVSLFTRAQLAHVGEAVQLLAEFDFESSHEKGFKGTALLSFFPGFIFFLISFLARFAIFVRSEVFEYPRNK